MGIDCVYDVDINMPEAWDIWKTAGTYKAIAALTLAVLTFSALGSVDAVPVQPMLPDTCGTVLFHADGSYEYVYFTSGWMVEEPDYGALAERYSGNAILCAVLLDLSAHFDTPSVCPCDVYLWGDDDGVPGIVLQVVRVPTLCPMFQWPTWTRRRIPLQETPVDDGYWWVGYWGAWPGLQQAFMVGADEDGPGGGRPMVKFPPGIEYPSGWQDIEVAYFPVAALGIGAEVLPVPVPVRESSWGQVKSLYRDATR